jgi:hypothetical protein
MLTIKFMDGTPVPQDYQTRISNLVEDAAQAVEIFGKDELERYAVLQKEEIVSVRVRQQEDGVTLEQFHQMLSGHDWYFSFSDDSDVYRAGQDSQKRLDAIAKQSPSYQALLDGFVRHYFPGEEEQVELPPLPVKPQ